MSGYKSKLVSFMLVIGLLASVSQVANTKSADKSFGYSARYGAVTPPEVYALLQNYETVFMYYVNTHKKSTIARVRALKLAPAGKKTPDDAFQKLHGLANSLDKLMKKTNLPPVLRIKRETAKAIPAEVFLQTGHNLDALVNMMNKLEPGKSWGSYYKNIEYKHSLKPADVYALADLLTRRLELVL